MKDTLLIKVSLILGLILVLFIPTSMIKSLINEREQRQKTVLAEVSEKWGRKQVLTGPYLSIPFKRTDLSVTSTHVYGNMVVLPDQLKINSTVTPSTRNRSIYELVVYSSSVGVSGSFENLVVLERKFPNYIFNWEQARLNFGMNDLKGLKSQVVVKWNGKSVFLNSGLGGHRLAQNGLSEQIEVDPKQAKIDFSTQFVLNGSESLEFLPLGKSTEVNVKSPWNKPSFSGHFLPDNRKVTKNGFEARWKVMQLNRNYPQYWTDNRFKVGKSAFGVGFLEPVNHYQQTYRTINYALLVIGVTFFVFFFMEIFQKLRIHPIQYALIGVALVLFFSLLLAFTEHISFGISYLIAALATIGLIVYYSIGALKSKRLASWVAWLLTLLYGFIYIVIQLEEVALLVGTIGVFIILAVTMVGSRKLDWYAINAAEKTAENELQ